MRHGTFQIFGVSDDVADAQQHGMVFLGLVAVIVINHVLAENFFDKCLILIPIAPGRHQVSLLRRHILLDQIANLHELGMQRRFASHYADASGKLPQRQQRLFYHLQAHKVGFLEMPHETRAIGAIIDAGVGNLYLNETLLSYRFHGRPHYSTPEIMLRLAPHSTDPPPKVAQSIIMANV